jgi:transcription elongation factor GreA
MLEEAKKKLADEIARLNHELNVTLPETLKKALALGDLRENGDYHAALERQGFVQARLSHLRSRLGKLNSIDLAKIPREGAGLGSRVVVLDLSTKKKESYELVVPDSMNFEDPGEGPMAISIASPLGRAMVEKAVGAEITVQLPGAVRRLRIVELVTFHQLKADTQE